MSLSPKQSSAEFIQDKLSPQQQRLPLFVKGKYEALEIVLVITPKNQRFVSHTDEYCVILNDRDIALNAPRHRIK
jgi:hypothetical protein